MNDAPEVGEGVYTIFNRGVSMGLGASEKDKIENDTYLLKYNKQFDMYNHTGRSMQSDSVKQKAPFFENEESFSQENNSIHFNTFKNKDSSSKIEKMQPYKRKNAARESDSKSSSSSETSVSASSTSSKSSISKKSSDSNTSSE